MSREELSELWGVLRRLGWFSLLQDAFSAVMFSNVLAYVRRRCDRTHVDAMPCHVMSCRALCVPCPVLSAFRVVPCFLPGG